MHQRFFSISENTDRLVEGAAVKADHDEGITQKSR